MNEENKKPDDVGSDEYYEEGEVAGNAELPGEAKNIKAETVKKEEIYEDKIKKQEAFIESLGRKREAAENSEDKIPEYVEKKSSTGKKIIWGVFGFLILGAAVAGGFWFWPKQIKKTASEQSAGTVVIPINQESAAPEPEESATTETEKIEENKPIEIEILVLNGGAAEGAAGKVKDFLASRRYAKVTAKNAATSDHAGAAVYYKDDTSKEEAEKIKELLLAEQKIDALVKKAATAEQKSAEIVIMLGK
jgi:hypothetical protein